MCLAGPFQLFVLTLRFLIVKAPKPMYLWAIVPSWGLTFAGFRSFLGQAFLAFRLGQLFILNFIPCITR